MYITPNFSEEEFTVTQHRGIDNSLPQELRDNAKLTCEMLERIRARLGVLAGKEITVLLSSGYRCLELNKAIGSKDTSDHVQALAADWRAPRFGTPLKVCQQLAGLVDELGIGQLIYEYGSWIHTSARKPTKMLNRILTINSDGVHLGIVP